MAHGKEDEKQNKERDRENEKTAKQVERAIKDYPDKKSDDKKGK